MPINPTCLYRRLLLPLGAALLATLLPGLAGGARAAGTEPVAIVAAENMYGDVAAQIGGDAVHVTSILSNPDQDPHLFEASPSVGRALSKARIVIYSGIDYDPWMAKLLAATHGGAGAAKRVTLVVAALGGHHDGDNPHVWYDQATMQAYARALAAALTTADPGHADGYSRRLAAFEASMAPIAARIAALRATCQGDAVTATEPVYGYMFAALGLQVRNMAFQLAVMNNTEPSARDVAAFEDDLRQHRVRLLLYNSQATDPIATRMMHIAGAAHVPVVGATETEPAGMTYQRWMLDGLDRVDRALRSR
ncbi:ABC transporter Mn2+/Zn2+ permease [Acidisphaera rubrifaciens HS-AP3]|uniref:ABC transporter Mn2+/Zn2+ permease n=1 Tax=Acidisphaera rubrifaciens HS-AP3 TaxID=1231350 RepID=A0A0D6P5P7_9PROT|nr:ABC transporter Mn2+/Zn2+ permease [Acidisphaera rubrifaciens HS-AP3]